MKSLQYDIVSFKLQNFCCCLYILLYQWKLNIPAQWIPIWYEKVLVSITQKSVILLTEFLAVWTTNICIIVLQNINACNIMNGICQCNRMLHIYYLCNLNVGAFKCIQCSIYIYIYHSKPILKHPCKAKAALCPYFGSGPHSNPRRCAEPMDLTGLIYGN